MKRLQMAAVGGTVGVLLLGLCTSGCASVSVTRSAALRAKPVEVHLVGLNDSEYRLWYAYSMSRYWQAGDTLREGAVRDGSAHCMQFTPDGPDTLVLRQGDPAWKIWDEKSWKYLFVLRHVPGAVDKDKDGSADPRRSILLREKWPGWGGGEVKVKISEAGVSFTNVSDTGEE